MRGGRRRARARRRAGEGGHRGRDPRVARPHQERRRRPDAQATIIASSPWPEPPSATPCTWSSSTGASIARRPRRPPRGRRPLPPALARRAPHHRRRDRRQAGRVAAHAAREGDGPVRDPRALRRRLDHRRRRPARPRPASSTPRCAAASRRCAATSASQSFPLRRRSGSSSPRRDLRRSCATRSPTSSRPSTSRRWAPSSRSATASPASTAWRNFVAMEMLELPTA